VTSSGATSSGACGRARQAIGAAARRRAVWLSRRRVVWLSRRPAVWLSRRPAAAPSEQTVYATTDIEAINGRIENLRDNALGFRSLTYYIARALLDTGGFRPRITAIRA
jgi:hypothetical protein